MNVEICDLLVKQKKKSKNFISIRQRKKLFKFVFFFHWNHKSTKKEETFYHRLKFFNETPHDCVGVWRRE